MILLKTERLILRELTINDALFFYNLANDPDWLRFIGDRNINSIIDSENYLTSKIIPSYKKNGFGFYLVKTKEGDNSIGITGLIDRDGMEDIEVGFAFLSEFRGKGYALESTKAIMEYASTKLKINPIVAITDIDNIKSSNLLEKLGLSFDKIIQLPGLKEPCRLFKSFN